MEPGLAAAIVFVREFRRLSMSHHWRAAVGRADPIQGPVDHDVEYFTGWIVSVALTVATVLVVWHYQI
jgi:hypothetical protein